ncbi:hypothetical protein BDZ89DRAFT_395877 [Hymenopellis radicata]|nr:hypothetical protein BDZ89DRAFT_395877 [Hymenopellis radicata]
MDLGRVCTADTLSTLTTLHVSPLKPPSAEIYKRCSDGKNLSSSQTIVSSFEPSLHEVSFALSSTHIYINIYTGCLVAFLRLPLLARVAPRRRRPSPLARSLKGSELHKG